MMLKVYLNLDIPRYFWCIDIFEFSKFLTLFYGQRNSTKVHLNCRNEEKKNHERLELVTDAIFWLRILLIV
jgi:hypothetical protein